MKVISKEEYNITGWLPCYLYYGDDSIFDYYDSRDTDKIKIDKWIDTLPPGGVWEFSEETEFCRDDILNTFSTCVKATHTVLK